MDRPVFSDPVAGPGPETLTHIRLWVAALIALLISGPVLLALLLLLN